MVMARLNPPTLLKVELAQRPRCGLCSFYPLEQGNSYLCPVHNEKVARISRPPRASGGRGLNHYICFHPMTELAWRAFWRIRVSRENARKKGRREDPEKHRAEVRRYQREHPWKKREWARRFREAHPETNRIMKHRYYLAHREKLIERAWLRFIIDDYDPVALVLKRFRYYRRMERKGHNLQIQRHEWRDFEEERDLSLQPEAPVEPYIPTDIQVFAPDVSGSEQRGGVDGLWKSHPDAYRRRGLKFARLDMQ
jgi:hypothetical protein